MNTQIEPPQTERPNDPTQMEPPEFGGSDAPEERWWGFTFLIGAFATIATIVVSGLLLLWISSIYDVEDSGFWLGFGVFMVGTFFSLFLRWVSFPVLIIGWIVSAVFKLDVDKMGKAYERFLSLFWVPCGAFFGLLYGLQGDGVFTLAVTALGTFTGLVFLVLDWNGFVLHVDD